MRTRRTLREWVALARKWIGDRQFSGLGVMIVLGLGAAVVLAIVLINGGGTKTATSPRIQIPYLPTFINQVNSGNVSSISSTSGSIQGTFKHEITYPPNSKLTTRLFSTQIPPFVPAPTLVHELEKHHVRIQRPH